MHGTISLKYSATALVGGGWGKKLIQQFSSFYNGKHTNTHSAARRCTFASFYCELTKVNDTWFLNILIIW